MKRFLEIHGEDIQESSLGRILQHFSNDKIPVAIISAFRKEFTLDQNLSRNKALAQTIKGEGYGYFYVEGHWIEDKGQETEKKVKEDAVFIVGKENDSGNLKGLVKQLIKKYNQDAAVFKDAGNDVISLLFKDGSSDKIGKYHPGKVGDYMTKLKHKGPHSTFVLESTYDDPNFFGSLANNLRNKNVKSG